MSNQLVKNSEEARVAYTLDRTAQGATVRQIATELSSNPATIRKYLNKISAEFIRHWPEQAAQIKGTQTLQIENILQDLFEQWESSKELNADGLGNLEILKVIRSYMGDLRTIWGADKPLELDSQDTPYIVRDELNLNQILDILSSMKKYGLLPQDLDLEKLQSGAYIDGVVTEEEGASEN